MTRFYIPLVAAMLVSVFSCKDVEDRFAFNPSPGSTLNFTLDIMDSSGMTGNTAVKRQLIEFSLQYVQQKDSLYTMQFVFEGLSITQPGIQMTSAGDGSVSVLPTGTYVTISTEEADTTIAYEEELGGYYQTWKNIMPQLRGDSLQVVINSRGEVQQVTGFERITDRIATATGTDVRTVRQFLGDYAGNESIRDLLNQLFFYLPGKKVQKGDKWVKNVVTTAKAPVKLSQLITAANIDEKSGEIELNVESVVSAKTGDEGRQYAEGKVTGKVAAKYNTGLPYNFELTQEVITHTDQYDVIAKRVIRMPRL
jgi:hypothetical protein